MPCPPRVRLSILRATFTLLAVSAAAACSNGSSGPGATGTAGAGENAPFAITVSQMYITIENRTGGPLARGEMEIIPAGVFSPFRATLPYLETGSKRDITLNTFRSNDGTPFNRSIARARRLKVTATDRAGKVFEHEVPFN